MKRLFFFILLFLLTAPMAMVAHAQRAMTVEDILTLKRVSNVQLSPDGQWIAYVVAARDFEENIDDSDVWVVRADGGEPVRLTYHQGPDTSPQWAPDGTWLAFRSNRAEEKMQVFGITPTGGEAWPVTDGATAIGAFRFAPDGEHLAFTANAEKSEADKEREKRLGRPIVWDSTYADQWSRLWVAPLEDRRAGEVVQWSPDSLQVTGFVWSPDSEALAFGARPSPVLRTYPYGAVYVQAGPEADTRQVTFMPGGEGPVAWTEEVGLLVSGTAQALGTYNSHLWRVSLDGSDPVSLTEGLDEHARFVAATAEALFVEAGHRTGRRLYRIPLQDGQATGEPEAVTDDAMYYTSFSASRDASQVAFLADDPATPTDVYLSAIADFMPQRRTEINPQLSEVTMGAHRVVQWASRADEETIEGVLTLPVGYRVGDQVPLLLVIHGGPSGVSVNRFSPSRGAYPIQVFAGMGFAVLQPNYRGSTNYGERFRGLNRGDISGRDWIDIDSGVDDLVRQGLADPDRLGIMGWSFGGHHTYWGITQTTRYKAASAGAGANDLISMYSQTDLPAFYHTYLGPKPWEDFDLYEERSAYRHVTRVTTPLLIQVGEKDERVPAEQSIQFYEAVKAIGKAPTKLILYPGQPHGVRDPRLMRDLIQRNVAWFTRWISTERTVGSEE